MVVFIQLVKSCSFFLFVFIATVMVFDRFLLIPCCPRCIFFSLFFVAAVFCLFCVIFIMLNLIICTCIFSFYKTRSHAQNLQRNRFQKERDQISPSQNHLLRLSHEFYIRKGMQQGCRLAQGIGFAQGRSKWRLRRGNKTGERVHHGGHERLVET